METNVGSNMDKITLVVDRMDGDFYRMVARCRQWSRPIRNVEIFYLDPHFVALK